MRVGVYLRQSLDRTGEGLAVTRQREDCQKLCDQRGWEPVFYEDNDTSATKGKRPGYERLLGDIGASVIGGVVAWDLDRLHRRPIELEHFMELADTHKLALATVTGDVDLSTDNGRLFARIKGAVARAEVERKSARQKRAARQSAESGGGWGGRRAFGYRGLEIYEPEAAALRGAYSSILSGHSLYSVAVGWNEVGLLTTAGNMWTGSTVRQTLMNARNAGIRTYHGEEVGSGVWQPIVEEDVWRAVTNILSENSRRKGSNGRKRLLTGILLCGRCGAAMSSGVAHGGESVPIYVCKSCLRNSRRLKPVDAFVVKLILAFMATPEGRKLRKPPTGDANRLREQIKALNDEIDGLGVELARKFLTLRQVKIATDELESQRDNAQKQLDTHIGISEVDELLEDPAGVWRGWVLDRRRLAVRKIVELKLMPAGRGRPFHRDQLRYRWLVAED